MDPTPADTRLSLMLSKRESEADAADAAEAESFKMSLRDGVKA